MAEPIFAFFDESGEEGFSDKSSEWFVLSAAIQDPLERGGIIAAYDAFKLDAERQPNWHFHFVSAKHRLCLAFIEAMREPQHVFMSVVIHKPSLQQTENFKRPYYLYFFAAKLLLERISWMATRQKRTVKAFTFSSRRGLKEQDVSDYLALLKANDAGLRNTIKWPVVEKAEIIVEPNKSKIGLQLADLMASSIGSALTPQHGITECRYLRALKPHIYSYNGSHLSYGLKFFPALKEDMADEQRFEWLMEFGL